ncbi:hypothetical protein JKF63_01621 [Porcisia hertigi]|uniref:Uncharacterized protein n=1 Tax=Porcisia hertigi TaxID=2761500 RepID=A0A836L0J4_9TRYP|nr:hypothetical protein JKF63_01621 [Porcisia hertigi]
MAAAAAGVTRPGDTILGNHQELQRAALLDGPALEGCAGAAVDVSRDSTTVIAKMTASASRALSSDLLAELQRDYPTVCEALQIYEKVVRHLKDRYKAKETELLRCISVGEELLGQMEVLKQRCEALAHERDEALAVSASAPVLLPERARATGDASLSPNTWWEEKRSMQRSHEAACERYRAEVKKALRDTAAAQAQRRELGLSLERTATQLSETEQQLRTAHDVIADCEVHHATKQKEEMERQRVVFARQLAEVRQQSDVDRETALAESMVELERLQRALVRAQTELAEQQKASRSSQALREEVMCAAAAEQASLQQQIHILAEANRGLQERLQQREAGIKLHSAADSTAIGQDDSHCSPVLAGDSHRGAAICGSILVDPLADARGGSVDNAVDASGLAAAQRRLREENARLRQKLQEVVRQGQDDVDEEHAARLSLQQQLQTMDAQSHILRTEVVGCLQQELRQAKEQLETCQAHSAAVQRNAAELEMQKAALQEEKVDLLDALRVEKSLTEQLHRELNAARERHDTLNDKLQGFNAVAQEKEQLIVQLQREKGKLANALRTLQLQAVDIEAALTTITAQQSESNAAHEDSMSRVRDRCVFLEHEAEELRAERATFQSRLRDAEEAIDVLKDAHRVSQELVWEAQRGTKAAEHRASVATDQLRLQQQTSAAHLAEVQQHLEHARAQHRDLAQQLERCQRELSQKEETLRKSTETQEALIAEVKSAAQAGRVESRREQWCQQLAQSNLEEQGKLIAMKEAHIGDLHRQMHELRVLLTESESRATQLYAQRQELQASLSDSLVTAASRKGRIQALEEELARTAEERSAAQRERLRSSAGRQVSPSAIPDVRSSGDCDVSATVRLIKAQSHLAESEAALCAAEQSRQRVQRTVLECLTPVDAAAAAAAAAGVTADVDKRWDMLLHLLRQGDQELRSRSSPEEHAHIQGMKVEEVGSGFDDRKSGSTVSRIIDANQRASAVVLGAVYDLVRLLHDADRCHWSCVRKKILAACAVADAVNEEAALVEATPLPTEDQANASWEKRCADFFSALRTWAGALEMTRDHLIDHGAQVAKAVQQASKEVAQEAQVTQLAAAVRAAEEQRDALQTALEEMTAKYAEAVKRADAHENCVESLRHCVMERDTRLREMAHRLDVRQAEAQAERAEWVSKWQEAQRHREAEKEEAEAMCADLRAQVGAAEKAGYHSTQRAVQESADALQQLCAQLQALRETSSATEVQLQQQVTQLSREKEESEQTLRQLKTVVAQLEGRLSSTEETLRLREVELSTATSSIQEFERVQRQRHVDGAVAGAFEQRALSEQVASLQAQLLSSQHNHNMQERLRASEKAEMDALRKVNASLEARLAEVEGDRAPLREQLHSLLSVTE